jgi:hypothetical protein
MIIFTGFDGYAGSDKTGIEQAISVANKKFLNVVMILR